MCTTTSPAWPHSQTSQLTRLLCNSSLMGIHTGTPLITVYQWNTKKTIVYDFQRVNQNKEYSHKPWTAGSRLSCSTTVIRASTWSHSKTQHLCLWPYHINHSLTILSLLLGITITKRSSPSSWSSESSLAGPVRRGASFPERTKSQVKEFNKLPSIILIPLLLL